MKTRLITATVLAGFIAAPAALASEKFEVVFDFSPTEAATDIGAEKIYDEMEDMIREKCEPSTSRERMRLRNIAATEECISVTLNDAVEKMDKPAVTEVHKARRG